MYFTRFDRTECFNPIDDDAQTNNNNKTHTDNNLDAHYSAHEPIESRNDIINDQTKHMKTKSIQLKT